MPSLECRLVTGVAALQGNIAQYDEGIVTRMKMAGFILLGKTATSQLGSFPYTENPGFLPTRNPFNRQLYRRRFQWRCGGGGSGGFLPDCPGFRWWWFHSYSGGLLRFGGDKTQSWARFLCPGGEFQSGIATNGTLSKTVADGGGTAYRDFWAIRRAIPTGYPIQRPFLS
jgi:amidase